MTLTRMHANVMPCTVGTPFYGSYAAETEENTGGLPYGEVKDSH